MMYVGTRNDNHTMMWHDTEKTYALTFHIDSNEPVEIYTDNWKDMQVHVVAVKEVASLGQVLQHGTEEG